MAEEPPVCEESTHHPGKSPFGKYNSDSNSSTPNDIPVYVPMGTAENTVRLGDGIISLIL